MKNEHPKLIGNDGEGQGPRGVVEQATARLRDLAVPEGPSAELAARTFEKMRSAGVTEHGLIPTRGWWTMKNTARLAAGFLLVALVGVAWLVFGRGATVAFADVIQQVRDAHSAKCTLEMAMEQNGKWQEMPSGEMLMVEPDWAILTTPGTKVIGSQGKMLMLMEQGKQAMLMSFANAAPGKRTPQLFEQFRQIESQDGKALGEKEIDGHKVKGFEVNKNGTRIRVWADLKTELPVLVEEEVTDPMIPHVRYTFSEFLWNVPVDQKELTLDPPAGYTLSTMSTGGEREKDVVAMLKTLADLNNDQFPDKLDMGAEINAVIHWLQAHGVKLPSDNTPKMMSDMNAQVTTPLTHGFVFIANSENGTNWRYAGKGAKLGDAGKAVLWYQPKGSQTYRVIHADLTVHEAKEADLPAGEPVKLDFPATSTATPPAAPAPAAGK